MGNAAVVNSIFDAIAQGDLEKASGYLTDDVKVHVPGKNKVSGLKDGKQAWIDLLKGVMEATGGTMKAVPHDILESGDHAVALVSMHMEMGANTLDWNRALIYHFSGDKVSEIWIHEEDQHAVDEFIGS